MEYGLLIARQRSGTGAVGTVLDQHKQIKYLGEVFHPGNTGQEQNFFTFLLEQVAQDPQNALPDNRMAVFRRFLDAESERHGAHQRLIVDIKYNSLHHLDDGWRDPLRMPLVIRRAREEGVPIIHLTRRNSVATFVSGRLAEVNKIWHARKDDTMQQSSVTVDIRQLSDHVTMIEREIDLISEWLDGHPGLINIEYANAFVEDGSLAPEIVAELEAKLGVEAFEKVKPVFVKQAPARLEQSIENFALVKRAFEGTPYQWMLEQ
jgi:LPS sulfotransferase NodH